MPGKVPFNPKPKLEFTDEQRALVRRLSVEGKSREQIAQVLEISVSSLKRHFRAELVPQKNGPKPIEWTPVHRDLVTALAGFGATPGEIGRLLKVPERVVLRDFEDEIDNAAVRVNTEVAGFLFKAAKAGNVSAQMFWLRARAGWNDGGEAAARRRGAAEPAPEAAPLAASPTPEATRANIREAAGRLSREGRAALRLVVDDLSADAAKLVSG